jgi:gamma-glutamyltranspeptidase/glutathione hydrolase
LYEGEIARNIARHMQSHGGLISEEDLATYRPSLVDGQTTTYRGCELVGVPGACGSITVQQGLNVLDGFDLRATSAGDVEALHLQAEVFRRVFADRYGFVGDPRLVQVPWRGLLSKEYAESRRAEIDPAQAAVMVQAGQPHRFEGASPVRPDSVRVAPLGGSTTHLCVVDEGRNVVSLSQTLVDGFGSAVVVPGTGVIFNNAMSWFDPEPGRANSLASGKRGLNNLSPMLVLRGGDPMLALGAAGGRKIMQAVAQVISNVVDYGMPVQEAVIAPRIDCSGTRRLVSPRFPDAVITGLRRLGHRVDVAEDLAFSYPFATPLAIFLDPKTGSLHSGIDQNDTAVARGY